MAEYALKGHHVKNLRLALYSRNHDGLYAGFMDQGNSFDHILDGKGHTIEIVAGSIDSVCERCGGLDTCESEGAMQSRGSALYDRIMARLGGVRVGEKYASDELIDKLQKQRPYVQGAKEAFGICLYAAAALPYEIADLVKPLSKGASLVSRVNSIVGYATFGLLADMMIAPGLLGHSLHEMLGMELPNYGRAIEMILLAAGAAYMMIRSNHMHKRKANAKNDVKAV